MYYDEKRKMRRGTHSLYQAQSIIRSEEVVQPLLLGYGSDARSQIFVVVADQVSEYIQPRIIIPFGYDDLGCVADESFCRVDDNIGNCLFRRFYWKE